MTPSSSATSDHPRTDVVDMAVDGPGPRAGCAAAVAQLDACLEQLDGLIVRIDASSYATPLEGIFGGSIGGHVRHCLDHVRVLVETMESPDANSTEAPADYDTRNRGTDIETDPAAARTQLGDLRSRLVRMAAGEPVLVDRPVALSVMMSRDGLRVPMSSTIGREIAFVFSHTIHHQAMIGGMARHLGLDVPAEFGRAPSTIAHDESRACAR